MGYYKFANPRLVVSACLTTRNDWQLMWEYNIGFWKTFCPTEQLTVVAWFIHLSQLDLTSVGLVSTFEHTHPFLVLSISLSFHTSLVCYWGVLPKTLIPIWISKKKIDTFFCFFCPKDWEICRNFCFLTVNSTNFPNFLENFAKFWITQSWGKQKSLVQFFSFVATSK